MGQTLHLKLFKNIYKISAGNYLEIDYGGGEFIKRGWILESNLLLTIKFNQVEFESLFAESVSKEWSPMLKLQIFYLVDRFNFYC